MKPAAIDARVSTTAKSHRGEALASDQCSEPQWEPLRRTAEQRGWIISHRYGDPRSRGKESRPGHLRSALGRPTPRIRHGYGLAFSLTQPQCVPLSRFARGADVSGRLRSHPSRLVSLELDAASASSHRARSHRRLRPSASPNVVTWHGGTDA